MINGDLDSTLIESLKNPACYPHFVESINLLETHISWVLLAGEFVYKIKKPVNFDFLDFSELAKRQFFCHEELRLNRRLAPDLYLDVIGIGGSPQEPVFGAEPAFEYAVKMHRFAEDGLLDHVLERGALTQQQLQILADTLAEFHAGLMPASVGAGFGDAEAVGMPARQNFQQLFLLLDKAHTAKLASLQAANEQEFARCRSLFVQRLQAGKVRECHGDLHLGNIVLINGVPTPFDGIEFNPALRWIDVINDIAFLLMDLIKRQRPDLAYAFVNAYLQASGDYAGLSVLRFYLGYRAMVMAKVSAIRAAQIGKSAGLTQCERYLTLAKQFYTQPRPGLIITHGLPGCGKTTVSQIILEKFGFIRIRSDVERKRLFGLQPHQVSSSGLEGGIYTLAATERTYQRLLDLSRQILKSGFSVIIDAAFLKWLERKQFRDLAAELDVPFVILSIRSDENILHQRIRQRQNDSRDASEADVSVYELLKAVHEPPTSDETVELVNNGDINELIDNNAVWEKLERLLGLPGCLFDQ